jgi:hypothetical protein
MDVIDDDCLSDSQILQKCMTIVADNCHISGFMEWLRQSDRMGEIENEQMSHDIDVVLACRTRALRILVDWAAKVDNIDLLLTVCNLFPTFSSSHIGMRNRLFSTNWLIKVPDLAGMRDNEDNLMAQLKMGMVDLVQNTDDNETLCIQATQSLLDSRTEDNETLHLLWDRFLRHDFDHSSTAVVEVKVNILGNVAETEPQYDAMVLPNVEWLVEVLGGFSPSVTQAACNILKNWIMLDNNSGGMQISELESKLITLLDNRTEDGKEEDYYGNAISLYTSVISKHELSLISDIQIDCLISNFVHMVCSEDSEVGLNPGMHRGCIPMSCLSLYNPPHRTRLIFFYLSFQFYDMQCKNIVIILNQLLTLTCQSPSKIAQIGESESVYKPLLYLVN